MIHKPKIIKRLGLWWCTDGSEHGGLGETPDSAYKQYCESVLRANGFVNQKHPFGGTESSIFDGQKLVA